MKSLNLLALLLLGSLLFVNTDAMAQTSSDDSVLSKLYNYFSGEEDKQSSFYNKKSKKAVNVTIGELDWTDKSKLSGSLFSAFKGNESLEVDELSFSPDFEDGYFYLSFNSEEEESLKVMILDVAGREVHNESLNDFSGTYEAMVHVPADEKGTYFLKVIQGFDLMNKKLVIN
ncbi:MAG: hypothetical protein AB8B69_24560 [Chitinophagales bacterium]